MAPTKKPSVVAPALPIEPSPTPPPAPAPVVVAAPQDRVAAARAKLGEFQGAALDTATGLRVAELADKAAALDSAVDRLVLAVAALERS